MAILFSDSDADDWKREFAARLPKLDFRVWPDAGNLTEITYACVWKIPAGTLEQCTNLRIIFSLGAGVDHLIPLLRNLPTKIPVVRIVDPYLTQRMVEYVVQHTLTFHRRQKLLDACQQRREWTRVWAPLASERRVCILGLGELGGACARALAALSFQVVGWSRSLRSIPGVQTFTGLDELPNAVRDAQVLICLLPLTADTENILNTALFALLSPGACLINPGRGRHLVEEDLLEALRTERIAHAVLDVFRTEPLPEEHPFWKHPQITVTPHVASLTDARSVVPTIVENMRRFEAGEPLLHLVDVERGY